MRIISWNVNGLRAVHRKGLFVPFIEKYTPDVLCLQEVKSRNDQNDIDLPEYEEYWNSAVKNGYSGTAIFTKSKPLNVIIGLPEDICQKYTFSDDVYGDPNTEGRVITAEFKDFFLVNVYTPNSKQDLSRLTLRHEKWDPAFLEYTLRLKQKKPVVFCGDLNVAHTADDLANPKQNEGEHGFTVEERAGVDRIIHSGFVDTFRLFTKGNGNYTWWTPWRNARERNIGWRIDYFFVTDNFVPSVKKSLICNDVFGSDHCPIQLDIEI